MEGENARETFMSNSLFTVVLCNCPKKYTYTADRCNVFQHVLETQETKIHITYFTYSAAY